MSHLALIKVVGFGCPRLYIPPLKLTNKQLNAQKWAGIFHSTFVTSTFMAHLGTTQGAKKIDVSKQFGKITFNKPVGALALCMTGVSSVFSLISLAHCIYSLGTMCNQTLQQ